jgi:hypothetical protein
MDPSRRQQRAIVLLPAVQAPQLKRTPKNKISGNGSAVH